MIHRFRIAVVAIAVSAAACSPQNEPAQVLQATVPSVANNAPIYTETPTPTLTLIPSLTPTATFTATLTPTSTPTPTATFTVTPTPTLPLMTLTPASADGAPMGDDPVGADFTTPEGWSCDDFPCEDDIEGFLQRIQVPPGFVVEHVGRFPGQPQQITYGQDGWLYATIWEDGTTNGAVYAMDADGSVTRYTDTLTSPIGLAFQPGTDVLYVSGRTNSEAGGALWRVESDGTVETALDNLPCCFGAVGNQPNGMVFGPDGYLYLGVGSLTDHAEPANPERERFATPAPLEASVLRIQPHTGNVEVYAEGIRNPFDVTFNAAGQFYATDNGILEGTGDRLLAISEGQHYGFPYWLGRDCFECPPTNARIDIQPDLLAFPPYTLPRGLVAYTGQQFPAEMFNSVFVTLWNGTPNAQRVIRVDPATIPADPDALEQFIPEPFMTGLIRPIDVTLAPDGSLVVADFVYGHIWRVRYTGEARRVTAVTEPAPRFQTATPITTPQN